MAPFVKDECAIGNRSVNDYSSNSLNMNKFYYLLKDIVNFQHQNCCKVGSHWHWQHGIAVFMLHMPWNFQKVGSNPAYFISKCWEALEVDQKLDPLTWKKQIEKLDPPTYEPI